MVKALRPHGLTFPQYEALLLLDFSKTARSRLASWDGG
jgi:hypothetical protein